MPISMIKFDEAYLVSREPIVAPSMAIGCQHDEHSEKVFRGQHHHNFEKPIARTSSGA